MIDRDCKPEMQMMYAGSKLDLVNKVENWLCCICFATTGFYFSGAAAACL